MSTAFIVLPIVKWNPSKGIYWDDLEPSAYQFITFIQNLCYSAHGQLHLHVLNQDVYLFSLKYVRNQLLEAINNVIHRKRKRSTLETMISPGKEVLNVMKIYMQLIPNYILPTTITADLVLDCFSSTITAFILDMLDTSVVHHANDFKFLDFESAISIDNTYFNGKPKLPLENEDPDHKFLELAQVYKTKPLLANEFSTVYEKNKDNQQHF